MLKSTKWWQFEDENLQIVGCPVVMDVAIGKCANLARAIKSNEYLISIEGRKLGYASCWHSDVFNGLNKGELIKNITPCPKNQMMAKFMPELVNVVFNFGNLLFDAFSFVFEYKLADSKTISYYIK